MGAVERVRREPRKEFAGRYGDSGRAPALYVGLRRTGQTLQALGEAAGGMDYSAVSMIVKRFEPRLRRDGQLREMAEQVMSELNSMSNVET